MSKQTEFWISWNSFHCFEIWLERKVRTSEMLLSDNLKVLKDSWNLWFATKYEVISQAGAMWIETNRLRVLNTIARCFLRNMLRKILSCYRSSYSWVIKGNMERTCRNSKEKPAFPRCLSRLRRGTCNMVTSHEQEDVRWPLTADVIDWTGRNLQGIRSERGLQAALGN